MLRKISQNDKKARCRLANRKLARGFLLLSVLGATATATMCCADQAPFVQDASFPQSHVRAEEAILRKLHTTYPDFVIPTTLNGIGVSLQRIGINARLDRLALEDLALTADEHIDWHGSPVSLAASLEQSLYEFDLTWIIRGGILLITTNEEAEERLRTKIYRVSGIVELKRIPSWGGTARQTAWQEGYDFDSLMELIKTTVVPESWDDLGGPGTIGMHAADGQPFLMVLHTDRVHDKVEIYLRRLHQLGRSNLPKSVSWTMTLTQSSKLPEVGRDHSSYQQSNLPGNIPHGGGGFF